jgi:GT2 family glycosyltransferase
MKFDFQDNLTRIQNLKSYRKHEFAHSQVKEGLSVIILNLDKPEFIIPLVKILKESKRIFAKENLFLEILIGDTGSKDPQVLELYQDSEISVVKGLKYHFSKNNNEVAFSHSKGSLLLFMNNDIIFKDPNFLLNFYRRTQNAREVGIWGHVLLFESRTIQHRGIKFLELKSGRDFLPYHIDATKRLDEVSIPETVEFDSTTGAFLMIGRSLFGDINGFNEDYEKEAQDIDLCLQVKRLGYQISVLNLTEVIHFENGTRVKGEESNFDRSLFVRLWSSFIQGILLN